MEKLSRDATDEGAKSYKNCNRRTLIRRLRRLPSYLREGIKGFSKMEKLSRNATDEGAKSYKNCNRRTLIRRLRRHLLYHREG